MTEQTTTRLPERSELARKPLWSETQLAAHLGINPKTLYRRRKAGTGPRFIKSGARVAYREQDIEAWLEEQVSAV